MIKLNLSKPLVFLDLETTGTQVGKDRIVEVCLLRVNVDNTYDIKTRLVNPEMLIPAEVEKIHGITNERVANEPTFSQLAHELNQFIGNADLAGYNSNKFDIPLLVEEFLRAGIDFELKNRRMIDVQNIFHKMEPRTLKAAYAFYCGQRLENAHSAEADTMATYEVFLAQLERYQGVDYEDRDGNVSQPIVNDVKALHEFTTNSNWVDLVGHIAYKDQKEVFNFGKHKGVSVIEVFEREPSYYDWMMKADFPLSTKKVITGIYLKKMNK